MAVRSEEMDPEEPQSLHWAGETHGEEVAAIWHFQEFGAWLVTWPYWAEVRVSR